MQFNITILSCKTIERLRTNKNSQNKKTCHRKRKTGGCSSSRKHKYKRDRNQVDACILLYKYGRIGELRGGGNTFTLLSKQFQHFLGTLHNIVLVVFCAGRNGLGGWNRRHHRLHRSWRMLHHRHHHFLSG